MKKFGLLFLVLGFSLSANAQEVKPIYFYGDQITADKDKATSYAIYGKLSTQELWVFKRYDLYNNLLQTGSYADASLTVAEGKFTFYLDVEAFNRIYNTDFSLEDKTRFASQEGTFSNGLEQGTWFLFYPNGTVFSAQNFLNGKMHGSFVTYDKQGVAIISGNYLNGVKDGEWITQNGKVKETYKMGVLVATERVKKVKM